MADHPAAADAHAPALVDRDAMVRDVARGLAMPQKELDPKYFYDERGSELFELITTLPEYYLTRSERAVLQETIPALISTMRPRSLVELGAGSASKTQIILDAMQRAGCGKQYVPVDVSADFLEASASRLREIYPDLEIVTAIGDFSSELVLPVLIRPVLFAFLGSTIGNFEEEAAVGILARIARQMHPGDRLLLGADLRKDEAILEAAYNDASGVTAEFNLNILRVLNRDLDADFDLAAFRHRAVYNRDAHRIEMHLDSLTDQVVSIPCIGEIRLGAGESIRTELSCKYDRPAIKSMLGRAGLRLESWMTGADRSFALAIARVRDTAR